MEGYFLKRLSIALILTLNFIVGTVSNSLVLSIKSTIQVFQIFFTYFSNKK